MGRRIRYRPNPIQEFAVLEKTREDSFLTPKIIVTIAAVWIVGLVVVVLAGYLLMQYRKFQNEFAPLADVCQGKWVNAASPYSVTPGDHPAVAVRNSSGEWQLDPLFFLGEVSSGSLTKTELVLCLEPIQEVFIESCPYSSRNDPNVTLKVERYYYKQDVRLVEAKTGRVITVQTFTGKSPRYCDKTEIFGRSEKTKKLEGTEIANSDIRSWALPHLYIK
ncbi:MAG: hypothetical protein HS126_12205 [Anaerolineales bacterium]|nr:hypothetical protein [Anaerolineales bacterium]